jgi:hypothetical protein
MDMQGAGAIAAAAVAAAGIPIALLVGRWQMRGAVRAADASYSAALDAVRAQAVTTHSQWRRGLRREAYSAFLLAVHEVVAVASSLIRNGLGFEPGELAAKRAVIDEALKSLEAAKFVVLLEGPDDLAVRAWNITSDCHRYADARLYRAELEEAQHSLRAASGDTSQPGHPLPRFMEIVNEVWSLVLVYSGDPAALEAELNGSEPSRIRELRDEAVAVLRQMPEHRVDGMFVLLERLRHPREEDAGAGSPARLLSRLEADRQDFVTSARAILDANGGT